MTETARAYTKRLLKQSPRIRKEFGQNFLIDDDVIAAIVDQVPAEVPLLEIGAGLGVMTQHFLDRNQEFWAIELDRDKARLLDNEFRGRPVTLLTGDALKTSLAQLWPERRGWVVGNLPYYITNPLIMHFLGQNNHLEAMTIMVQKEVAARICANPGGKDYGVLSIAVQASARAVTLFDVPPEAFIPAPKVMSTVLTLHIRPHPDLAAADEGAFFRVVKAAFSSRRKMLANTLSAGLSMNKNDVLLGLRRAGIDPTKRPETLSIAEFQQVAQHVAACSRQKSEVSPQKPE
ncbi:MAG: 16S rRNA (adenine(1518)-N(6)/adenine(1519)-N(6))-dimethyltransferase RsmA [Gracilibacteraceae bacterium]|nr:16S rRNA (adenine(1518)-N(6)/adenine(1519)-N(6))-dimethyltransferase RsmA [Gracilibacteraceae bacterium]